MEWSCMRIQIMKMIHPYNQINKSMQKEIIGIIRIIIIIIIIKKPKTMMMIPKQQ